MNTVAPTDRSRAACFARRMEVARLTRAGRTAREIAGELKIAKATVHRLRREIGIARPAMQPYSQSVRDSAERLLGDGASYAEVARTLGISEWCVRTWFPGRGWSHFERTEYIKALVQFDHRYAHVRHAWWRGCVLDLAGLDA